MFSSPHTLHGQPYLFWSFPLSGTDSVTSFLPLFLKHQLLADPIYLFGPPEPQTPPEMESISLPEQELSVFLQLFLISVNGTKHLQDFHKESGIYATTILPHPLQPVTYNVLFYHLKYSPVSPLPFSYRCLVTSFPVHQLKLCNSLIINQSHFITFPHPLLAQFKIQN